VNSRSAQLPLAFRVRSAVYDALISRMTGGWYRAVLNRLPTGCRLLDVGIGTGAALVANADLLVENDVRVVGVDVDRAYVERCRTIVARRGLDDRVTVRLESIDAHEGGPYDAAYFSGSFMLLPDPPATLRRVRTLLSPGGPVYFTQTFEHRRSRAAELAKPILRALTGIDFGRVTYESEFRASLADGGIRLVEKAALHDGSHRSVVLVVGR
jgi:SAM-dependent methyltransferase